MSILGPRLLLVFINDLPPSLKFAVTATDLYAHDTTLYTDKALLDSNLLSAFNLLQNWCGENGM